MARNFDNSSSVLNDPKLIIQSELKNYIARKEAVRKKVIKYSALIVSGILLFILAYIYLPGIIKSTEYMYKYFGTRPMKKTVQMHAGTIKKDVISKLPVVHFSDYRYNDDVAPSIASKYAALIYRYNNDFYGKPYELSQQYEERLLAYMSLNGFDPDDLCGLNRDAYDDEFNTLKEFLLEKTNGAANSNGYFNPIVNELLQTIDLYEVELEKAYMADFPVSTISLLRHNAVETGINPENEDEVIANSSTYLQNHSDLIDKVVYYRRKVQELEQELNIRLGLIYLAIGQDYKTRGDIQNYGWLRAGLKGKTFITNGRAPDQYADLLGEMRQNQGRFRTELKQIKQMYTKLNLDEWHLQIKNPLKIGLTVKDVGLFGARRKNSTGEYYEHRGLDILADKGTQVYPVQDGFITYVGNNDNGGNVIEIWHDENVTSVYAHLNDDELWEETKNRFMTGGPFWVSSNKAIASVGTTGNIPQESVQYGYAHLHLEIKHYNRYKNPFQLINEQISVIH